LERGILGGRRIIKKRTVLEVGKEGILLRLVDSVYLVKEQQRGPAVLRTRMARRLDRGADVLDAGHDGRQRDELGVGGARDEPRQGRLAGARWPPENQRVQPSFGDAGGERLAGPEDVTL